MFLPPSICTISQLTDISYQRFVNHDKAVFHRNETPLFQLIP
jgi:hypothetical protein